MADPMPLDIMWKSLEGSVLRSGLDYVGVQKPLIFKGKAADMMQSIDLVNFRVAWWFKHHGKGSRDQISVMLLNLKEACVEFRPAKLSKPVAWCPLSGEAYKFNVDGSTRGSLGRAGMGGVLKDSCRKVVFLFSYFIVSQDSNTAEIMAIWNVCDIISFDPLFLGRNITIASDSKVVVAWVNNDDFGSINHVKWIYDIRCKLKILGNTSVVYNSRSSNSFVDMLARRGSSLKEDIICWSNCDSLFCFVASSVIFPVLFLWEFLFCLAACLGCLWFFRLFWLIFGWELSFPGPVLY
ncbi:hypothetical protein Dsin_013526 [Dipteronia sinensis]|uniref:RNase H type-1 domain-containing protein n=1 Tax=Dipteronia sinensis TaxID=43782 RepID=A0AAE0AK97_9ROSI|nr:hypothetical protein Dsin_013526 [Dipteronia sinensis]